MLQSHPPHHTRVNPWGSLPKPQNCHLRNSTQARHAYKSEWLESGDDPVLSPTASLIEQPPHCTLESHFHRQNQFQVFVEGSGTIGAHALDTVLVHYAGAYTGYGPLISGAQGIKYFTIRPVCESGFIPVTDAREKMIRGPKRHVTVGPISASSLPEGAQFGQTLALHPFDDDGLGVGYLPLTALGEMQIERHPASQGVFVFVLNDQLQMPKQTLDRWEMFFVSRDEPMPACRAGAQGALVLSLHCPPKERLYEESPT